MSEQDDIAAAERDLVDPETLHEEPVAGDKKPRKRVSGDVVTVACKHPPGIYMRVFDRQEYDVPVLGGGTRRESRAVALGDPIKINGPAVPFGVSPSFIVAGGYALTSGVPADVARKWMADNKESPLVKNNIIFIQNKAQGAADQAKEQKEVLSGLERLDVRMVRKGDRLVPRDPRWPKSTNPNLTVVATDNRDVA